MAASVPSAEQFLASLQASGLLSPREIQKAIDAIPKDDRHHSPALAAILVRTKVLTAFQARKLLAGASKGMVLGPYRILAMLGRGGMGKVYLARDVRDDQTVALKVLPPHKAREEERLLTRFRREMELAKEVNHPSLARAYEAGVAGDVHYIAMEYVPGKTLSKIVTTAGPLSYELAARVFSEAADALAHAHERGLIHRDLKPSNLMITPAGHAKLLDLGLALRPGEVGDAQVLGGKGYVVGTMDYVPPEQTRDAVAVDARSDLYGLGATMFYALTGRPPFPGGTTKEKIGRHRREEPPRVDEYNIEVPEGLADYVDELLRKNPADRPHRARDVREYLRTFAAPPAPPDPPPDVAMILESLEVLSDADDEGSTAQDDVAGGSIRWLLIGGAMLLVAVAALVSVLVLRK